jgi:23S rRNA (pseudouridine1915-N3)-methyltransferase
MLKITILAFGNKMPAWVVQAVQEYSKRLQDGIALNLVELPLLRRSKSTDLNRTMEKEMALMSASIPNNARLIALDIQGETFSSEQLAIKLEQIQHISSHLCLLIGGPEGLARSLIERCNERWSLSKLTLPHTIARIVLLEAIYRAWSILHNHPYHK